MREVLNIWNLLPVFLFQIMLRIPGTVSNWLFGFSSPFGDFKFK